MKARILHIFLFFLSVHCAMAATIDCKPVVRVVTYAASGDTLAQGHGFFISADGELLAPYALFKGAARAEVIDWKGKNYPVSYIIGASSSEDLVRARCVARKVAFLRVSDTGATQGESLLQLYYDTSKKAQAEEISAIDVTDYKTYKYLTVSTKNADHYVGCPIANADGAVVGVVQKNLQKDAQTACAIDARFGSALVVTVSSALNADLRAISMPRVLPTNEDEAFSYIYMLSRVARDSVQFVSASADFTERYPANVKGFTEVATFFANHREYAKADEAIGRALALRDRQDEVRSTLCDIIYQKALYAPEPVYKDWTLERALAESEQAYALRPDTAYILQQANCLFGLKRYVEAHDRYLVGAKYSHQPAELYFYAANALEHADGDKEQVIALLDSAILSLPRPYRADDAPYLLARAQRLEAVEKYRAAVLDYNEYEKAIGARNLTARFYDIRQAAEQKAHMYQQAIDDLNSAIAISKTDDERGLYQLEIAFIYLRAGMNEECIEAAQRSLTLLPENPDAYKAMGIAHGELGHKADALNHLSRAQALGDPDVHTLIEHYAK